MVIKSRLIEFHELSDLIEFDKLYLVDVMKNLGIAEPKCPPVLEYAEVTAAYHRGDILLWLLVDDNLAGYMWRIKQPDCLFSAGAAIKKEFYGLELSRYIIELTEKIAKESGLTMSRIAVIPENGRAVNAFMKQGYQITGYTLAYFGSKYPETFRCIMQKNFSENTNKKTVIDSCEILCSDEKSLKQIIDAGYTGTSLIRSADKDSSKNKIQFQKFLR
jgi:hypothetical protein